MLIILPPSETKRPPPDSGEPLDLKALSFPELGPCRARVLDALIETSARRDALRRLRVGPSLAGEVARNERIRELPTRRAAETYSGPLYAGLDPAAWSPRTWQRAQRDVVIVSALWGALRPADRIPAYRLHVCSWLAGIDRLEPMWRAVLPGVLADAAAPSGLVVDLRSSSYVATGRPPDLEDRTATLRIRPSPTGRPHIGDVVAKRIRGEAARHLLEMATPDDPVEVATALAERWSVEVDPPAGDRRSWRLTLMAPDTTPAVS